MLKIMPILTLTLALASFGVSPASTLAQDAQASQAVSTAVHVETWPVAVQRFWEDRASETRMINGELWSIRGLLEGERLAKINTPAMQDMALAYQQPGAPNFVRLRDGKTAVTIADIARETPGLTVMVGRVASVEGDTMHFLKISPKWGYLKKPIEFKGLTDAQQARYAAAIFTDEQLKNFNKKGYTTPHVQLILKDDQLVELKQEVVSAADLRAFCGTHKITAFPDARPLKLPDDSKPEGPELSQIRRYQMLRKAAQYERQDFKWSTHTLCVPLAAR